MDGSVDRRTFLTSAVLGTAGVVAGVGVLSSSAPGATASAATGGGQPVRLAGPNFGLTKFLDPLRIPQAIRAGSRRNRDELTVTMTEPMMKGATQAASPKPATLDCMMI